MNNAKNYAKYRHELMALCPGMSEQEIYKSWVSYMNSISLGRGTKCAWEVVQDPVVGLDGKYHYVYITIDKQGRIYVGKHSCTRLDDDYQGSGEEVQKMQDVGEKLTTFILEFFRSDGQALGAEKDIVTREFVIEDKVLNQTIGGDDSRHAPSKDPGYQLPQEACDVISSFGEDSDIPPETPPAPVEKKKDTTATRKTYNKKKPSGSYWPFNRLEVPIGSILTFAKDESKFCKVVDGNNSVEYNGKVLSLSDLTKELMKGYRGKYTTLGFWKYNGRFLVDIADEFKKLGK